jgi:hypothetical protein
MPKQGRRRAGTTRSTSEILVLANIATTQRYRHVDDRELADAQDLVE